MLIAVPSRGRADTLRTGVVSLLPMSVLDRTVVFLHPEDSAAYHAAVPAEWLEAGLRLVVVDYENIAQKRQQMAAWAEDEGYKKIVMSDDDVDFLVRRGPDDWRLRAADAGEVGHLLDFTESMLDSYAQVAVSAREGNNRFGVGSPTDLVFECTRAMRITAYRIEDFLSVEHDRVPVMEDIDVTLQLLRSGRKNAVLAYWANGQRMTNAPGGCSIWRTHELHDAAARRLAELHPGLVRLRQKENKTDRSGFGTRTEVTVYWKRAYSNG